MKKLISLSIIFSGIFCQAQNIDNILSKANVALTSGELDKAITLYNKALEISPESTTIKEKLANVYLQPGSLYNRDMAMRYMEDAYRTGKISPTVQSQYISLLQSQRNFDKAIEVYTNVNKTSKSSNSLINSLSSAYYGKISTPKAGMIIQNLKDVNTEFSDFSPVFYKTGLAFVSTRSNRSNTGFKLNQVRENYSDLYQAGLTNPTTQSFDKPITLIGQKDHKYMQGPVTFTGDQNNMYLTRSIVKEQAGRAITSMEDKRTVMLEIAHTNNNNGWSASNPVVLNKAADAQNYSYAHPAFLNTSGTEMIFSSNMPGGFGGTDLYYSKMTGTEWSTPVNLGPEINTNGEEMFPYISKDGTLYFASSGLPGLGGLDIFKATGSGANFMNPENVGAPINSSFDDFGMIIRENNNEGYFTSNRPNGLGDDDIYYWKNPECNIAIRVYDAKTNAPLSASTVKLPCINKTITTDTKGMATLACFDVKSCTLNASSLGYNNKNMSLANQGDSKLINVPMDRESTPTSPVAGSGCKVVVQVLDKETNQPIEAADVNIKGLSGPDEINGLSKVDGKIKVSGLDLSESYRISASKSNDDGSKYIGNTETVNCKMPKNADGEIIKIVYLTRARVGSKFKIENIYYDLDKWNIKPRAAQELDNIVSIMKSYPTMEIEMGSHTDCRATIKYNETLSGKRAASAMEYIISKGIDRGRMSSKGYGESELTNGCACEGTQKSTCTEDQHQANRRTEFKIIKF